MVSVASPFPAEGYGVDRHDTARLHDACVGLGHWRCCTVCAAVPAADADTGGGVNVLQASVPDDFTLPGPVPFRPVPMAAKASAAVQDDVPLLPAPVSRP